MRAKTLAPIFALALASGLCALAPLPRASAEGNAPKEAEKTAAIRKLLQVTGSGQLGLQVMTQMIGSLKASMPKVPEKFWQDFMKEVNPDELVDMVVPIYDKHLSLAEVKEVIRFYETPAGKKLIASTPLITQESMEVGRRWGQELGQRVAQRLKEKGQTP